MFRGTLRLTMSGLAVTALLTIAVPAHAAPAGHADARSSGRDGREATQAPSLLQGWQWLTSLLQQAVLGAPQPPGATTTNGGPPDISLGIDPNG